MKRTILNWKRALLPCCRHETIGQKREGDAEWERAAFGRVLFGSRTIIVTKQHQQVQSYGSRGTKTTIATGMLKREPPRRGLTEVRYCHETRSDVFARLPSASFA